MKLILTLLIFALLNLQATGQQKMSDDNKVNITYCELIQNADNYNQKEVTIKATYRYGFEHSELYCLSCTNSGKTWVEFDKSFKRSTKSKYSKRVQGNDFRGRTVNIEATGIFYSNGNYGDGSYQYKFVIRSLKSAEIIANSGLLPKALSKKEVEKVCNK